MIQEYTQEHFEKDKYEMLNWLIENWTYEAKWMTYLGSILIAIKNLIEEWKRE